MSSSPRSPPSDTVRQESDLPASPASQLRERLQSDRCRTTRSPLARGLCPAERGLGDVNEPLHGLVHRPSSCPRFAPVDERSSTSSRQCDRVGMKWCDEISAWGEILRAASAEREEQLEIE
jgi:hypothetical protein